MTCLPSIHSMRSFQTQLLPKDARNLRPDHGRKRKRDISSDKQDGSQDSDTSEMAGIPMQENIREEGKRLIKTARFKTSFYYNSPFTCQQQEAYCHTMQDKGSIIFLSVRKLTTQTPSHPDTERLPWLHGYTLKFPSFHRFGPVVTRLECIYSSPTLLAGVATVKYV